MVEQRATTPDGLELRHLRAFVAVADDLNFGRAAARLFVSQSTLSRHVASLERMLGCVLLRRSTQHVALTPAGESLLERARSILGDVDEAVRETRAVGGELAARILRLGHPFLHLTYADVEELRTAAEQHYAQLPIAEGVDIHPVNAGGVAALVARPAEADGPTLLLLHGGAYVTGSAFGFRSLASALAQASGGAVLTPDYRLAPEHPFPAAIEDVEAVYEWLLGRGTTPGDVVLVGDTSGAGLALSLLLRLRARARPLPAGGVLITPWVDVGAAAPERLPDRPAPCYTRAGGSLGIAHYLDGHPVDDPLVDPLHADLTGLPPLLVQVAEQDEGADEGHRLARHARRHGVDVDLAVHPVSAQCFPMYWSFLPEAADAVGRIGDFARRVRVPMS
jgi:epsilon-lactone hydrolase